MGGFVSGGIVMIGTVLVVLNIELILDEPGPIEGLVDGLDDPLDEPLLDEPRLDEMIELLGLPDELVKLDFVGLELIELDTLLIFDLGILDLEPNESQMLCDFDNDELDDFGDFDPNIESQTLSCFVDGFWV